MSSPPAAAPAHQDTPQDTQNNATEARKSPAAPETRLSPTLKEEPPSSAAPEEGDQGATEPTADEGGSAEDKDNAEDDAWQAVFSADANAWYFWNARTNETTWSNPRASTSAAAEPAPNEPAPQTVGEAGPSHAAADPNGLPPIDPELAWLDPAAARRNAGQVTQTARFNARTGRFQADPALNPDRISEFQRGQRQQEAFYDVQGWEQSLAGKGLKRGAEDESTGERKRPSAKQIEKFKQAKEEKKRRKVASWLAN